MQRQIGKLNIDTGLIDSMVTREESFSMGNMKHTECFYPTPCQFSEWIIDNKGNLFIISANHGIFSFNPETATLFALNQKTRLFQGSITDNKGNIWLLSKRAVGVFNTVTGDVYVTERRTSKLRAIFSTGSFIGSNGNIWIPHRGGIANLDVATGEVTVTKYTKNRDAGGGLGFSATDGSCWLSSWGGNLLSLDEGNGNTVITDRSFDLLHSNHFIDDSGNVWIFSKHGILSLNTKTGNLTKVQDVELDRPKSVADKNGKLWITSSNSFGYFDTETAVFTEVKCERTPTAFVRDNKDNVWCLEAS